MKKLARLFFPALLLPAALLTTPSAFSWGYSRVAWSDRINFAPAGKISDIHSSGDLRTYKERDSLLTIYYQKAYSASECPSGTAYPRFYMNFVVQCAGGGRVTLTYTTNTGKVCHISITDGTNINNARIESADCDYSYSNKYYGEVLIDHYYQYGNTNQFKVTDNSVTDISNL